MCFLVYSVICTDVTMDVLKAEGGPLGLRIYRVQIHVLHHCGELRGTAELGPNLLWVHLTYSNLIHCYLKK